MAGNAQRWFPIATNFPAGLDTETAPTDLRDGFSPDAYGCDIDHPGRLAQASEIPTGETHVKTTYTVGDDTWTWYLNRLWRSVAANLSWGAPEYQDAIYSQTIPCSFDEDTQPIVTFFPAGTAMFVAKSTGGYLLPGAGSPRGRFDHGDIVEAMQVSAAANAIEFDDTAYVSNQYGIMAWKGGPVTEITALAKSRLSVFQNKALTYQRQQRRLVGTNAFVYDPRLKRLYDFSTAGFRFTSRTLTAERDRPFQAYSVGFAFENTTQDDGSLTFQVKRDTDWSDDYELEIRYEEDVRVRAEQPLDDSIMARQFAVRLTALSPNIRIREITVLVDAGTNIRSPSE